MATSPETAPNYNGEAMVTPANTVQENLKNLYQGTVDSTKSFFEGLFSKEKAVNTAEIKEFMKENLVFQYGFYITPKIDQQTGKWFLEARPMPGVTPAQVPNLTSLNETLKKPLTNPDTQNRLDPDQFVLQFANALGNLGNIKPSKENMTKERAVKVHGTVLRYQNLFYTKQGAIAPESLTLKTYTDRINGNGGPDSGMGSLKDGYMATVSEFHSQFNNIIGSKTEGNRTEMDKKMLALVDGSSKTLIKDQVALLKDIAPEHDAGMKRLLLEIQNEVGIRNEGDIEGPGIPSLETMASRLMDGVGSLNSIEFAALVFGIGYLLLNNDKFRNAALAIGAVWVGGKVLAPNLTGGETKRNVLQLFDETAAGAAGIGGNLINNVKEHMNSFHPMVQQMLERDGGKETFKSILAVGYLKLSDIQAVTNAGEGEPFYNSLADLIIHRVEEATNGKADTDKAELVLWLKKAGMTPTVLKTMINQTVDPNNQGNFQAGYSRLTNKYGANERFLNVMLMEAASGNMDANAVFQTTLDGQQRAQQAQTQATTQPTAQTTTAPPQSNSPQSGGGSQPPARPATRPVTGATGIETADVIPLSLASFAEALRQGNDGQYLGRFRVVRSYLRNPNSTVNNVDSFRILNPLDNTETHIVANAAGATMQNTNGQTVRVLSLSQVNEYVARSLPADILKNFKNKPKFNARQNRFEGAQYVPSGIVESPITVNFAYNPEGDSGKYRLVFAGLPGGVATGHETYSSGSGPEILPNTGHQKKNEDGEIIYEQDWNLRGVFWKLQMKKAANTALGTDLEFTFMQILSTIEYKAEDGTMKKQKCLAASNTYYKGYKIDVLAVEDSSPKKYKLMVRMPDMTLVDMNKFKEEIDKKVAADKNTVETAQNIEWLNRDRLEELNKLKSTFDSFGLGFDAFDKKNFAAMNNNKFKYTMTSSVLGGKEFELVYEAGKKKFHKINSGVNAGVANFTADHMASDETYTKEVKKGMLNVFSKTYFGTEYKDPSSNPQWEGGKTYLTNLEKGKMTIRYAKSATETVEYSSIDIAQFPSNPNAAAAEKEQVPFAVIDVIKEMAQVAQPGAISTIEYSDDGARKGDEMYVTVQSKEHKIIVVYKYTKDPNNFNKYICSEEIVGRSLAPARDLAVAVNRAGGRKPHIFDKYVKENLNQIKIKPKKKVDELTKKMLTLKNPHEATKAFWNSSVEFTKAEMALETMDPEKDVFQQYILSFQKAFESQNEHDGSPKNFEQFMKDVMYDQYNLYAYINSYSELGNEIATMTGYREAQGANGRSTAMYFLLLNRFFQENPSLMKTAEVESRSGIMKQKAILHFITKLNRINDASFANVKSMNAFDSMYQMLSNGRLMEANGNNYERMNVVGVERFDEMRRYVNAYEKVLVDQDADAISELRGWFGNLKGYFGARYNEVVDYFDLYTRYGLPVDGQLALLNDPNLKKRIRTGTPEEVRIFMLEHIADAMKMYEGRKLRPGGNKKAVEMYSNYVSKEV